MLLANAALSALVNLVVFAGFPFVAYFVYQKWRRKRALGEILQRAGLQLGAGRYLAYSAAVACAGVAILVLWPLPLDPLVRKGSPQQPFVGLGLSGPAVLAALLYGCVQTGFPEEFLFRGLIAGSLSRRLPLLWANLGQAFIFLIPHLLVLTVMPELWGIFPIIFAGALFCGWVRIKSGSIFGTWLLHASSNVAMCLSVAVRTAT
jgi:membrane protease YdiL (CAAX protease family)